MPSRRIINKQSKPLSKRYLRAVVRTREVPAVQKVGVSRAMRWSNDFVVCDGGECLKDILDSLRDPQPEFVVLRQPRADWPQPFLAVRPRELRRVHNLRLARGGRTGEKGGRLRGGFGSFKIRQEPAFDAVVLHRDLGDRGPGAWTRRIVHLDEAGRPREVGEPVKPGQSARQRYLAARDDRAGIVTFGMDVAVLGSGYSRGSISEVLRRIQAVQPPRPEPTPAHSPDEPPPPPPGGPESRARDVEPEHGTIVRHPSIRARHEARPGETLLLDVNLLRLPTDPDTESTGFRIEGLPDDWDSLPIHVHVASEHLEFDAGRDQGTILVQRDQESIPCTVAGRVSPECTETRIEVVATFSHRRRPCALAQTLVPVAGRAQEVEPHALEPEPAEPPPCEILPAAEGAMLTVYIRPVSDSTGRRLLWILQPGDTEVPGLPARLDDVIDLGVQPRTFVKRLLDQADSRRKGMHANMLESLGQLLYEYAPPCFQQTYWALRRANADAPDFPIQFICGEPSIPWEMMYPYDADSGESAGFLFAEHPVARWLGEYSGWMSPRFRKGRVLSITPNYARARKQRFSRIKPLPWAQKEGKFLRQKVGARSIRPTLGEVIKLLKHGSAETVSVLHFAGHGSYDWHQPGRSRIFLEDEELNAMEIRNANFVLGKTHRPLVIFNACETGASGRVLDKVAGWANSFLHTRFGGFIAPLWSVYDDDAAQMVAELVTRVMTEDVPVSVALQQLRRDYAETSPSFLAYLYYGDVMARVA